MVGPISVPLSPAKRLNVDLLKAKCSDGRVCPETQDRRRSLDGGSAKPGMTALKHEGYMPTALGRITRTAEKE